LDEQSHTPGLMLRMIRTIREGHDVVIASRYQPGSRIYGLSIRRRVVSRLGSLLMRSLFPTPGVSDFTSGYRAYRASALKQAYAQYGDKLVEQDGFQCMVDILLKLRTLPLIFGEVPMILRYDLKRGPSKMRLTKPLSRPCACFPREGWGGRIYPAAGTAPVLERRRGAAKANSTISAAKLIPRARRWNPVRRNATSI
jgi:hypothetical protein